MQLEMPAWMQKDENTIQRATRASSDPAALEWLSMFEEASGFRVRLIPNIERSVVNTFSQIPFEKNSKYSIKANSLGFRSAEIKPEKNLNTFRILIFGDSSSFGWGVNQNESFSFLLPSLLKDTNSSIQIEVGNFAIPGDSSEYGHLIAQLFIPKYNPDLVILGFGANDAKRSSVTHTSQVEKFRSNSFISSAQGVAQYSALFRSLRALITRITKAQPAAGTKKDNNLRPAVTKERYSSNLKHMAKLSIDSGAKQVLILNLCTPNNYARTASKLAEEKKLLYLNGQALLLELLPMITEGKFENTLVEEMRRNYPFELKRDPLYYITSDACHPNKLGHKVIADRLAEIIAPIMNK